MQVKGSALWSFCVPMVASQDRGMNLRCHNSARHVVARIHDTEDNHSGHPCLRLRDGSLLRQKDDV